VAFLKTLFSRTGLLIMIYFIIGVLVGPPPGAQGKLPTTVVETSSAIVAWIQFFIWVLLWPLGVIFHHAAFTL
jgi:hypothetical protein